MTRSLNEIIEQAVENAVARVMSTIERTIDRAVSQRVRAELGKATTPTRSRSTRRRRTGGITRWVADVRARRVPKFVIEATGLATKKSIVARFGENAAFAKGKPLPQQLAEKHSSPEPKVKAKPPIIRRKGAAAA